MKIQKTQDVWLAMTNTDCTEGRGNEYPKYVCASKATAIRLGKKGYVQGSNCPVKKDIAVMIENKWYIRGLITSSTKADDIEQKRIDEIESIIERLKEAGFSDDEIKKLKK